MTNRKAKRKATSVPPSNQPTTSEQNPQTDGGVMSTERDRLAEELLQIIKANPQLYDWDETTRTVMWKGDAERRQQGAKKNASTVSVMPIRENPNAQILHALELTIEEYVLLKLCAPGVKPSECTAQQRLLLHQLEKRYLTKLIEYPHLFNGPRWVLTDLGETKLECLLLTVDIPDEPAKVTAIPVRSTRSRR